MSVLEHISNRYIILKKANLEKFFIQKEFYALRSLHVSGKMWHKIHGSKEKITGF